MHFSFRRRSLQNLALPGFLLAFGLAAGGLRAQDERLPSRSTSGRSLARSGIEPYAVFSAETWGNVSGGLRTGAWYDQLLDFGVRLDTTKLGWRNGGSFLIQGHWVENVGNGPNFGAEAGAFNPISGIMAENQIRVFNLYYRQSWLEDAVVLKVGQIAVDDDFMLSDYSGLFLNSAFGAMPSQVGTPLATSYGNGSAFPIYSVASPGMVVKVYPTHATYSQLGVYYGNPGLDSPGNYGFDWMNQTPELGLFWENGISYSLSGHQGTFRLGLTAHTGRIEDYRSAANGTLGERESVPTFLCRQ